MPRRGFAAVGALVAGLLTPGLARATTADDLCAAATNPCVWSGNVLVGAGSTLDFGARDFVIAGSGIIRVAAGDTLTIRARRLTLQPGAGGRIRGGSSVAPRLVLIDATDDVVFQRSGTSRGRIDVRGESGGGWVSILADGDVDMGGEILALGTTTVADGGSCQIVAAGNVTLNGTIDVSGGVEGVGGDVVVNAGGTLLAGTLAPEPVVDARGGFEGGSIELVAGSLLNLGARVIANGTGAGSDGGYVDIASGGDLNVLSQVMADGSGSIDFGGFGGDMALSAGGSVVVAQPISLTGGFPDGEGGTLDITASVDVVQGAQLFGHALGTFAFGGTFLLTAGRTATLGALIDLHGGDEGGGGYLQVQGGQLVEALGEVNANGEGGYVLLSTLTCDGTISPSPSVTLVENLPPCEAPAPVCSNGVPEPGEACDDGNTTACDGCSGGCRNEGCGNGVIKCGETCDDTNATGGDGCSVTCAVESCFVCTGVPSVCLPTGGPGCVATTTSTTTSTSTSTTATTSTTTTSTTTVPTSSTSTTSSTATSTSTSTTSSTVAAPLASATCPGGCDDGDPCTTDSCVDGVCQANDVSGLRRTTCVCERSARACAGEAVSSRFTKKVEQACAQIDRAAGREPVKAKKPARSAVRSWKAAGRLLGKRAVVKDLTGDCVAALRTHVSEALGRTQLLLSP